MGWIDRWHLPCHDRSWIYPCYPSWRVKAGYLYMVIPCNIDFSNKTTDLIISLGRKKAVSLIKKVISMSLAEDGQGTICARFARFAQPYIYIYIAIISSHMCLVPQIRMQHSKQLYRMHAMMPRQFVLNTNKFRSGVNTMLLCSASPGALSIVHRFRR